jgi:Sec-independent protein translocase protein TatA
VLLVVLLPLIFGAKRLPEMGKSLGREMREFMDGVGLARTRGVSLNRRPSFI